MVIRSSSTPICVTQLVIVHLALQVDPQFLNKDVNRLQNWVGNFVRRNKDVLAWRLITSHAVHIKTHGKRTAMLEVGDQTGSRPQC